jgi:hypothetical protein
MKSIQSVFHCLARIFPGIAAVCLLSCFVPVMTTSAETANKTTPTENKTTPTEKSKGKYSEARLRAQWQKDIARVPVPKKGCFTASYPSKQWKEVPCVTAPTSPFSPRQGTRPYNIIAGLFVGGGCPTGPPCPTDFSADVKPNFKKISLVTGSFDTVLGTNQNPFSLQINTGFFDPGLCGASPPWNPLTKTGCHGWQQFIYTQTQCKPGPPPVPDPLGGTPCVFMQYWLIDIAPADCSALSAAWTLLSGNRCYRNSSAAWPTGAPPVTAAQLDQGKTTLTACAASGGICVTTASGAMDSVKLVFPGGPATPDCPSYCAVATGDDSVLNLQGKWEVVEWNVFGDGSFSPVVNFSSNAKLVPRISITHEDGSNKAPVCVVQGFTGETNNLTFGPKPPKLGPGPALLFTEDMSGGTADCAKSTSIGDTHLTTLGGTLYDFQASGDFILLQTTHPDFVVQARQVSGSPNWPNASVNKVVGVDMGKTRVAICLPPTGLVIDGKPTAIKEEDPIMHLPYGADISRRGNVYIIRDAAGNSLRAAVNDSYIDVTVGLGRWPTEARGVLANARGNANLIAAKDGKVLSAPFPFQTLYGHYADSWRVEPKESVLSACGEAKAEPGLPQKPFFAKDLPAEIYKKASAVCTSAGVKIKPLLDACILDVAVIGQDSAAKVYVGMPAPLVVGDTGSRRARKY